VASSSRQSKASAGKNGPQPGPELASNRSVLLLLGVAVAAVFVFSYLNRINDLIRVRGNVVALQGELAAAQQRNAELEATRNEVVGAAYVGETARAELGMIQPGDDPFVILGQEAQAGIPGNPADLQDEGGTASHSASTIFQLDWWRALFGLQ